MALIAIQKKLMSNFPLGIAIFIIKDFLITTMASSFMVF